MTLRACGMRLTAASECSMLTPSMPSKSLRWLAACTRTAVRNSVLSPCLQASLSCPMSGICRGTPSPRESPPLCSLIPACAKCVSKMARTPPTCVDSPKFQGRSSRTSSVIDLASGSKACHAPPVMRAANTKRGPCVSEGARNRSAASRQSLSVTGVMA
eukprot:98962-Amphidinium_carterae.2